MGPTQAQRSPPVCWPAPGTGLARRGALAPSRVQRAVRPLAAHHAQGCMPLRGTCTRKIPRCCWYCGRRRRGAHCARIKILRWDNPSKARRVSLWAVSLIGDACLVPSSVYAHCRLSASLRSAPASSAREYLLPSGQQRCGGGATEVAHDAIRPTNPTERRGIEQRHAVPPLFDCVNLVIVAAAPHEKCAAHF